MCMCWGWAAVSHTCTGAINHMWWRTRCQNTHAPPPREFSELSEGRQTALLLSKSNLVFSRAEPKHKQARWVA
jgi:hypothetical protein